MPLTPQEELELQQLLVEEQNQQRQIAPQAPPVVSPAAIASGQMPPQQVGVDSRGQLPDLATTLNSAAGVVPGQATMQAGYEKLTGQTDLPISARADEVVAEREAQAKANPGSAALGKTLGNAAVIAPTIFAGPAAAGAGMTERLINNPIVQGAVMGGVQGYQEAPEGEKFYGTVKGAGVGAGIGVLGAAISKLGQIGKVLEESANTSSVASLDMATGQLKRAGASKLQRIGKLLRDENITNQAVRLKTVGNEVEKLTAVTRNELNGLVREVDAALPEAAKMTKADIFEGLKAQLSAGTYEDQQMTKVAMNKLERLAAKIPDDKLFSASDVREFAQALEELSGKYLKKGATVKEGTLGSIYSDAAGALRGLNHHYAEVAGLGEKFAPVSERMELLIPANQAIKDTLLNAYKPSTSVYTGVKKLMAFSQPVRGALTNLKGSTGEVLQAVASGANKLGEYAPVLRAAAKRGPQALNAAHYMLMQTDPKYRDTMAKETGMNEEAQ